ncbi:transglycosylase family protein [Streptomyces sp. TS71-3]|uniref:transglycosylase family protein n=1 Tax=Streptomyces sp. TS71-3 TaxID=2733862 RepID=UPI0027E32D5A|nr:transglycosylase family protein [Streptomyces sp. TS71-3]
MTGSAIAIPLLGATGAHADGTAWKADNATWNRLANCESGGSWSADPGNSYYGGLQLSANMWVLYGGLDYAPRPDQASRSEQIAVAQKVLAGRGPGAWPGCADIVGLGKSHGSPSGSPGSSGNDQGGRASSRETGTGATGDPSRESGSGSESGVGGLGDSDAGIPASTPSDAPGSSSSSHGGSSSAPADGEADHGGVSSATPSGVPSKGDNSDGSGRHRGGRAHEAHKGSGGDGSDGSRGTGRHASRGAGGEGGGDRGGVYTVRPGDNLSAIADSHDLKGGWPKLYAANKKTVGADPDLILPGQNLDLF